MLTDSLHETVTANSSGGALPGTRAFTRQPKSVPYLMLEKSADTTSQFQVLKSLAIDALQSLAEGEAVTSAVNSRFAGVSSATIAGVIKRGRHRRASFRGGGAAAAI